MRITRFEDFDAWKAARTLAQAVTRATQNRGRFADPNLIQQLRNCADSGMANIVEGFESWTDKEFVRFLKIAYRSVSELQSHMYFALDSHFVDQETFSAIHQQAQETKALIGGFMRYLRGPINFPTRES